ncbi:sugar phosphate nucleotidyltransferase, partial [Escherichia coli]
HSSVIAVMEVAREETNRYGIIDPLDQKGRIYDVKGFVEKPKVEEAPSNVAIIGRYILTPEIFDFLSLQKTGSGGEIQLTDAIEQLN